MVESGCQLFPVVTSGCQWLPLDTVKAPEGPITLSERELETGGDEAVRSPAASITAVIAEKSALYSLEDDSSIKNSLCGDGRTISVELLVDDSLPLWQKFARQFQSSDEQSQRFTLLACRLRAISLGTGPEVPVNGMVITPGPTGVDFARQDPQKAKHYGCIIPHVPRVRTWSRSPAEGKEEEGDDAGSEDQPPPVQGPNPPPEGRGDKDSLGDDKDKDDDDEEAEEEEDEEEDDKDSEIEDKDVEPVKDPENMGTLKYYNCDQAVISDCDQPASGFDQRL